MTYALAPIKDRDELVLKELAQAGSPLLLLYLVADLPGVLVARNPGRIGVDQVIALRISIAALALPRSSRLLEAVV